MALSLTLKEKKALKGYIELLKSNFPGTVNKVLLFGSKARGDARKDSDIDLLVATNKRVSRNTWKEMTGAVVDLMLDYDVDISPRIMSTTEFVEWSPFTDNVKRDAVVLWSRKKYKNL